MFEFISLLGREHLLVKLSGLVHQQLPTHYVQLSGLRSLALHAEVRSTGFLVLGGVLAEVALDEFEVVAGDLLQLVMMRCVNLQNLLNGQFHFLGVVFLEF